MYPAALAIVVDAYRRDRRGQALAMFFGIAGGLTAVGPALGGYLTAWTWRSIFWINVPVAVVALVLIARAGSRTSAVRHGSICAGSLLITAGVALSVFGLQQSATWGWTNPLTVGALVARRRRCSSRSCGRAPRRRPADRPDRVFRNRVVRASTTPSCSPR